MSSNGQGLAKHDAVKIDATIVREYMAHSCFDVDFLAEASAATSTSAESYNTLD
jgi:hypothetical protein